MTFLKKRNSFFLFLCFTLSLIPACSNKPKLNLSPQVTPTPTSRLNLNEPLTLEQRRDRITSGTLQSPQEYSQLVNPNGDRGNLSPFHLSTTLRISPDALAELINSTIDIFFGLSPNLDQVLQLLQQNGGTSHPQQEMMRNIKTYAFHSQICQTGHDYVRLMSSNLPNGVSSTRASIDNEFQIISDTIFFFLFDDRLQETDVQQVRNFIINHPGLRYLQPAEEAFITQQIDDRLHSTIQIFRNRIIDHLSRAVRNLLDQQRGDGNNPESDIFRYYLIHPPTQVRQPHPDDDARPTCSSCGDQIAANERPVLCPGEDCDHAWHSGIELLDHILQSFQNNGGTTPVSCEIYMDDPEAGHELYISNQDWEAIRGALNAEINRLGDALQRRGIRVNEVDQIRQHHGAAPIRLHQAIAENNREMQPRLHATNELTRLATNFGILKSNILGQMVLEEQIPSSLHFPSDLTILRGLHTRTANRIRTIRPNDRVTLDRILNGRFEDFETFDTDFPLDSFQAIQVRNDRNDADLNAIRENVNRQLRGEEPQTVPTVDDQKLTKERYLNIARQLLDLKRAIDPLKRVKEELDLRKTFIDRQTQLRNLDDTIHRWKLQTLIAYYRHLRGSERQINPPADRPYQFCGNHICNDLITRDQVQNGSYTCGSCRQTYCYHCTLRHPGMSCTDFTRARHRETENPLLHDPNSDIRPCPYCLAPTHRTEACYHMDCPVCHSRWNWQRGRLRENSGETTFGPSTGPQPPRAYRVRGDQGFIEGQDMETSYPATEGRVVRRNRQGRVLFQDYRPAINGGYIQPTVQ